MPTITLLTDLGTADWYVGSLKGQLLKMIPDVNIVDITHDIPKYDISKAGFILKNTYSWFPDGTIHIISVDASVNFEKPYVCIRHKNQYFIGTDNGVFSLAFGQEPLQAAVGIENIEPDAQSSVFQARDIFSRVAKHIVGGVPIDQFGKPLERLNQMFSFNPVFSDNGIQGNVLYTDDFGNVITNVLKADFERAVQKRKFTIILRRSQYNIHKIGRSYFSTAPGEMVALFNSSGYLEIAINGGSAHQLLGMNPGDRITILLDDTTHS